MRNPSSQPAQSNASNTIRGDSALRSTRGDRKEELLMSNHAPEDPANLELSPADMQAMGNQVMARSVAHLAALEADPILGDYTNIEALCRSLREDAPERGTVLEALLGPLFDQWIPRSFGTAHSGYMAYIPGGSMAMFNAIACAREKLLGDDIRSGTLHVSSQTRHCVIKAAKLAGIAHDRVRVIDVDADFRMRVDALEHAMARRCARCTAPLPATCRTTRARSTTRRSTAPSSHAVFPACGSG